jgi:chromate transport protein ChrA
MKRLSNPDSLDGITPESARHPSFGEAFLFWLKLGFISFGGPTGQIAVMHTELVEKKKWISEARFLHALNYCMLLPGPEAQQLATYVGWLLHKTWGGIVAGAFFVIPSIFILWGLSYIYVTLGNLPWIAAIFYGLKPAVLAIVAAAVIRIGSRALKNEVMWTLAAAAFIAIFFFRVPFPLIIISAALIGFFGASGSGINSLSSAAMEKGEATRSWMIPLPSRNMQSPPGIVRFGSVLPGFYCGARLSFCWAFGLALIIRWFEKGFSSASLQWSLSAVLMRFSLMWRNRLSKRTTGSPPVRCSTDLDLPRLPLVL